MVRQSPSSARNTKQLTTWGVWVKARVAAQGRGVLQDAHFATGVAYSTLSYARHRLVTEDIAELLEVFTEGDVSTASMTKPKHRRAPSKARSRKAAA